MKLRYSIFIIILLVVSNRALSQVLSFTIKDSAKVASDYPGEDRIGAGILYHFSSKDIYKEQWVIYYDNKKIAAQSEIKGDTCIVINYWENGNIKAIEKFFNGNLFFEAIYCENATLLHEGMMLNCKSDTSYYCNGKYNTTYDAYSGQFISWDENGKKMIIGKKFNCLPEGLWKALNEDGTIDYYTYFNNGKELYRGKELPNWLPLSERQ